MFDTDFMIRADSSNQGYGCLRGAKPLFLILFPLSFKGEGDKGGEVDK